MGKHRFKYCTLCERKLTLKHFQKSKTGWLGRASWCRECMKKKRHEYYLKRKEQKANEACSVQDSEGKQDVHSSS